MIFELAQDFHDAVAAMPRGHPKHCMLELLQEAIRRDIHFIDCHPTTLFQCMWNTCWWYDCPEAAKHYEEPESGWPEYMLPPPWDKPGPKLFCFLQHWRRFRAENRRRVAEFWIRSLLPPVLHLGLGAGSSADFPSGHAAEVLFDPDGKSIAVRLGTTKDTGLVRVLDVTSGRVLFDLCEPSRPTCLGFLPEALWVVGYEDAMVRMFDARTGELVQVWRADPRIVRDICVSPSGKELLTVGTHLNEWDIQTGSLLTTTCLSTFVRVAAYAPDGSRVVCGCENGDLCLFERGAGWTERCRVAGHGVTVRSRVHSSRTHVLRPGHGRIKPPPSRRNGRIIERLEYARVEGVAFSPNGQWVYSNGEDGGIGVWQADKMVLLKWIRKGDFYAPHCHSEAALSPDGATVALAEDHGVVRFFDTQSGSQVHDFVPHEGVVTYAAWSPDGRLLATVGEGGLRLWDGHARGGTRIPKAHDHAGGLGAIRPLGHEVTPAVWEAPDSNRDEAAVFRELLPAWAFGTGPRAVWQALVVAVKTWTGPMIRLVARDQETVFEDKSTNEVVGWFCIPLHYVNTHPTGRVWAATGTHSGYIYYVALQRCRALGEK